jgi:hypothetical protein
MTLVRTTALVAACVAAIFACNKNDRGDRAAEATTTTGTTTTGSSTDTSGSYTGSSNTGPSNTGSGMGSGVSGAAPAAALLYQAATARIVGARCDREVTCKQIGPDKRFGTREICANEETQKTQDELKSSDCDIGVDSGKLQTCLAALSRQDCGDLVLSLQHVDACKAAALCR